MTPEEIKALQDSIAKLEANNARLTSELKAARKTAEITPEQLALVEAERDKLQTELIASQKANKEATKALELTQKTLHDLTDKSNKATIDTELTTALIGAGVKDNHYLTAVKALFSGQAKISDDGKPLIGDKPLSEAIKEWAATDVAKHFQSAPTNAGGGSQGGSGGQQSSVDTSKMSPAQKLEYGLKQENKS